MAINGISSMLNSRLRLTGMASGLDTETMIAKLMQVERMKVDKVKQQKQLLEWRRDDYRSISSLLKGFSSEYFDVLKPSTYFRSPTAFGVYKTTVLAGGKETSKVSVNATAAAKAGSHTLKISQLAQNSVWGSTGTVSKAMAGEAAPGYTKLRKGKELDITLDGVTKRITLKEDSTAANLKDNLQGLIDEAFGKGNITVEEDDGTVVAENKGKLTFSAVGHSLRINDVPNTYLGNLGFAEGSSNYITGGEIDFSAAIKGKINVSINGAEPIEVDVDATSMENLVSQLNSALASKSITVSSDGNKLKFISNDPQNDIAFLRGADNNVLDKLGIKENSVIKSLTGKVDLKVSDIGKSFEILVEGFSESIKIDISEDYTKNEDLSKLESLINDKLEGSGVRVEIDENNIIKFVKKDGETAKSVSLINSKDSVAKNLGFKSGDTNTLNTGKSLAELNVDGLEFKNVTDANGNTFEGVQFMIKGETFTFSKNETLSSIMSKINTSTAGVTLSYSSVSDKLTLQSNAEGLANALTAENTKDLGGTGLLSSIFKLDQVAGKEAKDAKFTLDGVETTRSSNQFTVDGVEYKLQSAENPDEIINITVSTNPDDMVDKIKKFVEKYNEMIDVLTSKVSEKRPRSGGEYKGDYYLPLTDEQREAMSEDDIKRWEEKAKKGLLKGDSILNDIANKMRSAMYDTINGVDGGLYSIGIKTGEWKDNGKLVIDEEKLKKALIDNPEKVMNIFTKESSVSYSPDANSASKTARYKDNGIANRLYDIIQDSIRTTRNKDGRKGILLEKAGIEGDVTEFQNLISKEIGDKDDLIYILSEKLIDKENYYYTKFAAMEQALSRMNSQSSWIAQQFGGQ